MQTITAQFAKTHFGQFLDMAQHVPVQVTRYGRAAAVLLPPRDFEVMRAFYAERKVRAMKETALQENAVGITEVAHEVPLADET
jgi:PHD/YefM family antitoxin component YafN of YafNO toxin-antitoxin module